MSVASPARTQVRQDILTFDHSMRTLRFLYSTIAHRRRDLWLVCVVALCDGFIVNGMAVLASRISVAHAQDNEGVIYGVITCLILSLGTSYLIRRYGETLALTIAESTRARMIERLGGASLLTLQRHHSGYTLSLINRVADTLQPVLFNLIWWGVRSLTFAVVLVAIMYRQSPLILILDVAIVVVFVLLSQWLSTKILTFNKDVNHAKSGFMSVFADFASNVATVRRLHLQEYMKQVIHRERRKVEDAVVRQQEFHAARWLMLHAVFGLLFTMTFGLLTWQMRSGVLTIAGFVTLIWFFFGLRGDLNQLAENLKVYTELGGYIEQIEDTLTHDSSEVPPGRIQDGRSIALIEDAVFTYPSSKIRLVIPHLAVYRHEVVAITGASGQGKSTLLHLIAGLVSPQEGTVSLGVPLTRIGIVSQEVELFHTTLRENITLGKSLPTRELMEYLEELDLRKLVDTHPEGLEVLVGEKGLRLSSGQKQRVNILRAFVQRYDLLLLDEPIAHLDPRTSKRTIAFIHRHLKGKTCVVVSHQSDILSLASRTYLIKGHRVSAVS